MTEEHASQAETDNNAPALDAAERRGRTLAFVVLGGLLAAPFYLESAQLSPSDLTTGLNGDDVLGFALTPVGISGLGWARLTLWGWLLGFVYRGHGWARMTAAALSVVRGSVALYHTFQSGFASGLAVLFLVVGVGYLCAAFALLRSSDLALYLARQRARRSQVAPEAAV